MSRRIRGTIGGVSILLAGGGEIEALRPFADVFIERVRAYTDADRPRVAIVVAANDARLAVSELQKLGLAEAGFEVVPLIAETEPNGTGEILTGFDGGELLSADGVVVADGQPIALLAALEHRVTDLRRLAHEGVPYFGIGAGAVIAAEAALIEGNEIGGVEVAPLLNTDSEREVQFAEGLGLVDLTILAQAAQLGRVSLAVACVEAGLTDRILALDTNTALEISESGLELRGTGSLWQITATEDGVIVTTSRAESAQSDPAVAV